MKTVFLLLTIIPFVSFGQNKFTSKDPNQVHSAYVESVASLTQEAAFELIRLANESADSLNKKVSVAVLDASGVTILLAKGDKVGPHNTEASRRKAYTALSTKTASFELMQKAASDQTANNLNTLPELLLLGGGVPIWKDGQVVGSLGISGAGGGQSDHDLAKKVVEKLGFSIINDKM